MSFDEKPPEPKGTKASMGVYVFKWKVLRQSLCSMMPPTAHPAMTLAKNIIPKMIGGRQKNSMRLIMTAGTGKISVQSKAIMPQTWSCFAGSASRVDLNTIRTFPIYSNNYNTIPQIIGKEAEVRNSLICDGCVVEGKVVNSIIAKERKRWQRRVC